MAETDGLEMHIREHQSIRAHAAVDAGVELIRTAAVMRIEQHQFHVPLVERLHLLGAAEADQMLLVTASGLLPDALLLHFDRHPVLFAQTRHDAAGRHKRIPADPPPLRATRLTRNSTRRHPPTPPSHFVPATRRPDAPPAWTCPRPPSNLSTQ